MVPAIGIGPVPKPAGIEKPRKVALSLYPFHCRFISVAAVFYGNDVALVKEHVVQQLLLEHTICDVNAGTD